MRFFYVKVAHTMEDRLMDNKAEMRDTQSITTDVRSQRNVDDLTIPLWWAMSAPYRRELKAKAVLDNLGIENFIPMRYQAVRKRTGSMSRELLPAVHNLIFVRGTKQCISRAKQDITWLQWLTRQENGKNIQLTVPDRDMEQFIAVTRTYNEHLIYIRPDEVDLRKGAPVRILGGPFNGLEGTFVKVKGVRNKRVVVMLKGIVGVAMAEITSDLLEVL